MVVILPSTRVAATNGVHLSLIRSTPSCEVRRRRVDLDKHNVPAHTLSHYPAVNFMHYTASFVDHAQRRISYHIPTTFCSNRMATTK